MQYNETVNENINTLLIFSAASLASCLALAANSCAFCSLDSSCSVCVGVCVGEGGREGVQVWTREEGVWLLACYLFPSLLSAHLGVFSHFRDVNLRM